MENNQVNQSTIQWHEKVLHLKDLRPFESNPRSITEAQYEKLKASLASSVGQYKPLTVTHDYRIAGGHQRLRAMHELGWESCRVSMPDRPLTDEEYKQVLISDNHNNGVFDMDALANLFDLEELRGFGLHEVMNVPPFGEEEEPQPGKSMVQCPKCNEVFPVKGHRPKEDA